MKRVIYTVEPSGSAATTRQVRLGQALTIERPDRETVRLGDPSARAGITCGVGGGLPLRTFWTLSIQLPTPSSRSSALKIAIPPTIDFVMPCRGDAAMPD